MKLKVISSGSRGNCYLLESSDGILVIEAGVPLSRLKQAVDFQIHRICGVLVSHAHGDHAKYADQYKLNGLGVISEFTDKVQMVIGPFRILPFEIVHDVTTFGFLVDHKDSGQCLIVSDTHYLPYTFRDLNNLLIECNYSLDILDRNVSSGKIPAFLRQRIINSHLELETVKGIMRANDLRKVNNIVLIHLSDANSDAERFKKEISELTGKRVTVAESGLEMDFNKEF